MNSNPGTGRRRILGFVGCGLLALAASVPAAAPALAQPTDDGYAAAASFRSAYQRAGRPRIVVFWNRSLTDGVATEYEGRTRFSSESEASVTSRARRYSNQTEGRASSSAEVTSGVSAVDRGQRYSEMSERRDWQVESVLTSDLISAGATVIDRSTIMRLTGKSIEQLMPNAQAVETRALVGYADILVEVLQTEDESSPIDTAFRVNVKSIRNGQILAQFVTRAVPPQRKARWVAGPSGFVRETLPGPSANDVARQLSNETLSALARGMGRR